MNDAEVKAAIRMLDAAAVPSKGREIIPGSLTKSNFHLLGRSILLGANFDLGEPTGRLETWAGFTFQQISVKDAHLHGTKFVYCMSVRPDAMIYRAGNYYAAQISGDRLPTRFRTWETAARGIEKALKAHYHV
jgi:hypothetical protein